MARNYQVVRPYLRDKSYDAILSPALAIPDNSAAGVTKTIDVPDELTIGNLQVHIALEHPNTGEMRIELTSLSGTRSRRDLFRFTVYPIHPPRQRIVP